MSDYNVALQGAGIAIVAAASALGASVSFWIAHAKQRGGKELVCLARLLTLLKGLGTGVCISTALIHLIAEASDNFGPEPEGNNWSEITGYDSWNMVFALIGILLMGIAEFFTRRTHLFSETSVGNETRAKDETGSPEALMDVDHGHGHGHEHGGECSKNEADSSSFTTSNPISSKRTSALMMEVSVLTHSVMVGLTLGLQTEEGWKPLVVAILFHQFFEGIALAQVIAEARYESLWRSLLALLAFVLTTPIGIAIGMIVIVSTGERELTIGVRTLLGILNSVCGGFLLYIGMINLLNGWFVQDKGILRAEGIYALLGWTGVTLGMAAMAIIGIWA